MNDFQRKDRVLITKDPCYKGLRGTVDQVFSRGMSKPLIIVILDDGDEAVFNPEELELINLVTEEFVRQCLDTFDFFSAGNTLELMREFGIHVLEQYKQSA